MPIATPDMSMDPSAKMTDEVTPQLLREFRHVQNYLANLTHHSCFNAAEAIVPHFTESLCPYVETLLQDTLKQSATTQAWCAHIATLIGVLDRQVIEALQMEYAKRCQLRSSNESHGEGNGLATAARIVASYLAYRVAVGRTSCDHEPELMAWLAQLCVSRSGVGQERN